MHELRLGRDDGVDLLLKEAFAALVVAEAGEDDVGRALVQVGVVAVVEAEAAVPRLEPEPEGAGRRPS